MARRRKENPWAGIISATIVLSVFLYIGDSEFREVVHMLFYLVIVGLFFYAGFEIWKHARTHCVADEERLSGESAWSDQSEEIEKRLLEIDWFQFEKLVAMIYKSQGFQVKHEGGAKPDKGVDLLVDSEKGPFVVQCKHWRKKNVSVKEIRELLGTMVDQRIHHGVFVTMHGYTKPAKELADRNNIILCDAKYLEKLINSSEERHKRGMLDLLYSTEKECPQCGSAMADQSYTRAGCVQKKWQCPSCRYLLKT